MLSLGEQRLAGAAGPQASRQGADYPRPPCFPLGSKWEGSVVAKVSEKTHTGYLGRQGKRLVVEDVFAAPGSDESMPQGTLTRAWSRSQDWGTGPKNG